MPIPPRLLAQAEYLRVPYADVGPIKVPQGLSDEQVLFLSDIFPTGFMAADFCNLKGGETVAIWRCGPVGQFAIKSAFLLGTERVIIAQVGRFGRSGGKDRRSSRRELGLALVHKSDGIRSAIHR